MEYLNSSLYLAIVPRLSGASRLTILWVEAYNNYPNAGGEKKALEELFNKYDLTWELKDTKLIKVFDNTDTAEMLVTTQINKILGPEFEDRELETLYTFVKENGEWKFRLAEVVNYKAL
jgi:hypothetical protein